MNISDIFKKTNLSVKKKHKIEKILLEKRLYWLFFVLVKAAGLIKRSAGTMKTVWSRIWKR